MEVHFPQLIGVRSPVIDPFVLGFMILLLGTALDSFLYLLFLPTLGIILEYVLNKQLFVVC